MIQTCLDNMFALPLPIIEKIARSIIVYLFLIILLRVFGKRELAQVNPFDLVVLLTLSNSVQNAIIGEDNTITGGMIGAVTLVGVNWLFVRMVHKYKKLDEVVEGAATVLIEDGKLIEAGLKEESLSENELIGIINRQGFAAIDDVHSCVLETNGTFAIIGKTPSTETLQHQELLSAINTLQDEVRELRKNISAR